MKKYGVLLAILALVFASLACQTVAGGNDGADQIESPPPADETEELPAAPADDYEDYDYSFGSDSDFPVPDDAKNVVSVSGTVNYQTDLSLDEVLDFYRDLYGKQGYTEREILTTVTDSVFSIVFDGDASGEALVIQGVDLGDGTTNVNISLQDT
jgi:hypothetical protein